MKQKTQKLCQKCKKRKANPNAYLEGKNVCDHCYNHRNGKTPKESWLDKLAIKTPGTLK